MAVDLTGGLPEDREHVFVTQPEHPEMRESVNAWIWNDGDAIGLPRFGIEAVADQWDTHDLSLNVTFPDGRALRLVGKGEVHPAAGEDGVPRVLGAGPLSFEMLEPFRRWRMRYSGVALETSAAEQMSGGGMQGEPTVPLEVDIVLESAVPPWENGALLPEAKRVLDEQDEGALMGGPRFEQLGRARGTVRVGDDEHVLDGGALRIRRVGIRRLGTFRGHTWQSALFPSGRAFGSLVYPDRTDGLPTYNEAFLYDGDGRLQPARVVEAPWLTRLQATDEDVPVVLESEDRKVRIEGRTVSSSFMVLGGVGPASQGYPVLQQAIVKYSMDGETANGMLERSMPSNLVEQS